MNFLHLEPEIVQRLQDQLAALRPAVHVLTAADLTDVTEDKQLTPAVHVVFDRYRPVEARPDGRAVRVEQTWMVVVAVRSTRALKTGDDARGRAGVLAHHVLQALQGWQAPSALKPLQLAAAPKGGFSAGYQYLPLCFTAEVLSKTSP